MAIICFCFS